ncbi:MAG: T9SS type A sorting domain-containing protein [Elusimicrobia bacterium]|nr:T9SS type A sorting domain-containing protein [Elusimicrobiota bacterium]
MKSRGLAFPALLSCLAGGAALPASAEMTGGDFVMVNHMEGPGLLAEVEVGGDTWTFASAGREMNVATAYPLEDAGCSELMPAPWGFPLYSREQTHEIEPQCVPHQIVVQDESTGEDFDFYFNTDPMSESMRVDPAVLQAANSRLSSVAGPQAVIAPNGITELNLELESGSFLDSNLAKNAVLSLSYNDADGDGIVDGSNPAVRVKTLSLYMLDEARGMWVKVPGSIVDQANHTVSAALPHLSVYALIAAADEDVSSAYAFPVPWAPNSGDPLNGTLARGITFTNLPSAGEIEIYTVTGRLVKTLAIPPALFPAQLNWNVKNEAGQDAASGVYLWRIRSGQSVKTGKLMVIR